jgi:hypothetical protein
MRRVISLTFAFVVASVVAGTFAACKKGDCTKGCTHLVDLATTEMESQKLDPAMKKSLLDDADKNRQANIDQCVQSCNGGGYNAACLEEAKSVEGAKDCKK